MNRPGISLEFLRHAGVAEVDAIAAQKLCELAQPGLWIPYFTLERAPVLDCCLPYGRLRLAKPTGKQKYHQQAGSCVHIYLPPGLAQLSGGGDLVATEGEFKALSLVEAGTPAIGLSGFYGATDKEMLVAEFATVVTRLAPARILFVGDTDTAFNWQFSDASVKLSVLLGRDILLPRLPFDGPKGIDDCRGQFCEDFPAFWRKIVDSAAVVTGESERDLLAVRLAEREAGAIVRLGGARRDDAMQSAVKLGAALRNPIARQALQDMVFQTFGTKVRTFQNAVKARAAASALENVIPWIEGMPAPDGRQRVVLPGDGREVSAFATAVGEVMAHRTHWFIRTKAVCVIATDPATGVESFDSVDPAHAVSSVEQIVQTGRLKCDRGGPQVFEPLSMRPDVAAMLIKSDQLRSALPRVDRILQVPVPIRTSAGTVVLPTPGYNREQRIWLATSAPTASPVSLDNAHGWLKWMLQGFPFVSEQDRAHFIANLVTYMAAGLMPEWNTRSPLFVYLGNRPRVGKDYLAGIAGLLFDGHAGEESPITGDDAEVTKRLVTAMRRGRRRLHFANSAGFLESPAFEAFITTPIFSGRLLGASEDFTGPNETIVSISGRTGATLSPDLLLRSRLVRLTWADEDINSRTFAVPDLHHQILQRRGEILSGLVSFVLNWVGMEKPPCTTPFSSFPDWGRVVGGIMVANGLGNPCAPQNDELLPMDRETADMKSLFMIINTSHSGQPITSAEIMTIIRAAADESLFEWIDLTQQAGRSKFGTLLRQFAGRVLGGVRLDWIPNRKSERSKFKFHPA